MIAVDLKIGIRLNVLTAPLMRRAFFEKMGRANEGVSSNLESRLARESKIGILYIGKAVMFSSAWRSSSPPAFPPARE